MRKFYAASEPTGFTLPNDPNEVPDPPVLLTAAAEHEPEKVMLNELTDAPEAPALLSR